MCRLAGAFAQQTRTSHLLRTGSGCQWLMGASRLVATDGGNSQHCSAAVEPRSTVSMLYGHRRIVPSVCALGVGSLGSKTRLGCPPGHLHHKTKNRNGCEVTHSAALRVFCQQTPTDHHQHPPTLTHHRPTTLQHSQQHPSDATAAQAASQIQGRPYQQTGPIPRQKPGWFLGFASLTSSPAGKAQRLSPHPPSWQPHTSRVPPRCTPCCWWRLPLTSLRLGHTWCCSSW